MTERRPSPPTSSSSARRSTSLRAYWSAFLPLAWAFLSVEWSADPMVSMRRSIALTGTTLFGLYLGLRFTPRDLASILFLAMSTMVAASALSAVLLPGFGVHQAFEGVFEHHAGTWRGLFAHKNRLGELTAATILLTLALWRLIPVHSGVKYGMIGISVITMIMSDSATALVLTVMFGTAVLGQRTFSGFPPYVRAAIVCAGLAFALLFLVGWEAMYLAILEALDKSPDLSGRSSIWASAFAAGMNHPIMGSGYAVGWTSEGYFIHLRNGFKAISHPHSGYIDYWLDLGVIGLVLLVPVFVSYLQRLLFVDIRRHYEMRIFMLHFFLFYLMINYTYTNLVQHSGLNWFLIVTLFATSGNLSVARKPVGIPQPA